MIALHNASSIRFLRLHAESDRATDGTLRSGPYCTKKDVDTPPDEWERFVKEEVVIDGKVDLKKVRLYSPRHSQYVSWYEHSDGQSPNSPSFLEARRTAVLDRRMGLRSRAEAILSPPWATGGRTGSMRCSHERGV